MHNPLEKDFDLKALLLYTLPSMLMMLFMSTYSIIDGVFVSNFVGEDALAAINIIIPLYVVILAMALMFSTGGNAVMAKLLGENKGHEARQFLSVLYIIATILGLLSTIGAFIFTDQIVALLGTSESLYGFSKDYLISLAPFSLALFYQVFIQSFMVTAGKPGLGLVISVMGGLTNIILDYILISPQYLDLGIAGAGIATGLGSTIPGLFGLLYFTFNRKSNLYFVKPKLKLKLLSLSIFNGASELIGNLAVSITTMMFNIILLEMVGDSGVSAISVILYIQMFQNALYFGYTLGVSPIISFKYGQANHQALHKVIHQSFKIITISSILVVLITILFSNQAIAIFISNTSNTFEMAKTGLLLFLPAYIFMGYNIFFSAMFTALLNGKISAIISILRSLVFIVIALMFLPELLGLNGVWLAIPFAEFFAIIISWGFYKKYRKKYNY